MSGNYGGNSIPTTPLNVAQIIDLGTTTYKNYMCSSIVASAGSASFTYEGQAIAIADGHSLDLLVKPYGVTAAAHVIFMCYDCSCSSPMSGNTVSGYDPYSATTAMFRPVIIGGSGLNS